jgi:hypothetical protein
MAQEEGAAKTLLDIPRKAFGWTQEKPKFKQADPKDIEAATETFRKRAATEAASRKSAPKPVRKKSITKKGM